MSIAKGVFKKLVVAKESTYGTIPASTGGVLQRRVTSNFQLERPSYQSNEINPTFQVTDMRLGTRSVTGTINGELSPGSYAEFMGAIVAKDFAAVTPISGLTVTIAASGQFHTVARAAGSWITDGIFVGNVIRLTGGTLDVANVGNNLLVLAVTALTLTVKVLSQTTLVAQSAIASVTATVTGKQTFAPTSGHTDNSYTVEEWYGDISQSEISTGVKFGSCAMKLPSTGLATVDFSALGRDRAQTGTTQYFTTPTAAATTGIFAAVNGAVVVNGTPVAVLTNLDITIERAQEAATVVGSNFASEVFVGKIGVTGSFSSYFQDATFRDYFTNETNISLVVALTTGNEKNAHFLTVVLPKIKLTSATKSDGELGLTQDQGFTAVLNDVSGTGLPLTTILIQDSAA